jgi:hypothetical protein
VGRAHVRTNIGIDPRLLFATSCRWLIWAPHYNKSRDLWHFLGEDSNFCHRFHISMTICKILSWITGGPQRVPNWATFQWWQYHISSQIKMRNRHRSILGLMTYYLPSQIETSNHHKLILAPMTICFCHIAVEVWSESNSWWAKEKGREWCGLFFKNFDGAGWADMFNDLLLFIIFLLLNN